MDEQIPKPKSTEEIPRVMEFERTRLESAREQVRVQEERLQQWAEDLARREQRMETADGQDLEKLREAITGMQEKYLENQRLIEELELSLSQHEVESNVLELIKDEIPEAFEEVLRTLPEYERVAKTPDNPRAEELFNDLVLNVNAIRAQMSLAQKVADKTTVPGLAEYLNARLASYQSLVEGYVDDIEKASGEKIPEPNIPA